MTKTISTEFAVAHAFINGIKLKNKSSFEFSTIKNYISALQNYFNTHGINAAIIDDINELKYSYNNLFEFTSDDSIITLKNGVTLERLENFFYTNNKCIMNAFYMTEHVNVLFQ